MNARRAKSLLLGGTLGAAAVLTLALLGVVLVAGWGALPSAVVGGLAGLIFFMGGQAIQVAVANRSAAIVTGAALGAHVLQVAGVTAIFLGFEVYGAALGVLDRNALFAGVAGVTVGWVAGMIRAFTRLRIPVFDADYKPPT